MRDVHDLLAGVETPVAPLPAEGQRAPHPGAWDTRLFSIICRYLNSGFPVLVGTTNHAFTLVGWYREDAGKLVKDQQPDGSWQLGRFNNMIDKNEWYATACALYFLGPPPKK